MQYQLVITAILHYLCWLMLPAFFKDTHTKETVRLAWPLVLTQVGHIVTMMVDNFFLGQLGPAEQAAGILSHNLFVLLLVFSIGLSYAATPLVTGANERQDLLRKASLFKNSFFLNAVVAITSFIILFFGSPLLQYIHQPHEVVKLAIPFFNVLIFSMIPMSLFFTCKQYCEGLSNTRMALFISIAGNVINIVLNYGLIYGKLGLPHLGYMGSAWASFTARLFMGLSFILLVFKSRFTNEIVVVFKQVRVNLAELKELLRIGLNTAMQFTFEVAAFVIAGLMAGCFGKEHIDAHGIALNFASFTYMFGSGIGSACTIRSGILRAQHNWEQIKHASGVSIRLVVLVMGVFGLLFLFFHRQLPLAFSAEPAIIHLTSVLLVIAAMFQLFDGVQVTIIGILRGLEDVKIPTYITLVGYWIIALPLAYMLAFTFKMETAGVWIALLISLAFVAIGLYLRLNYLVKKHLVPKAVLTHSNVLEQ